MALCSLEGSYKHFGGIYAFTLMMEEMGSSEILVTTYKTARVTKYKTAIHKF
jgi:hypothetical protein